MIVTAICSNIYTYVALKNAQNAANQQKSLFFKGTVHPKIKNTHFILPLVLINNVIPSKVVYLKASHLIHLKSTVKTHNINQTISS